MQSQQSSQGQSGYSDEKTGKAVPEINADQMVLAQKIQVLGMWYNVAISSQKLLPGSSVGGTIKPIKTSSLSRIRPISGTETAGAKTSDKVIVVKTKVIEIDKLLKGSVVMKRKEFRKKEKSDKKQQEVRKKEN